MTACLLLGLWFGNWKPRSAQMFLLFSTAISPNYFTQKDQHSVILVSTNGKV
jgi:hypothetical protein